MSLRPLVEARDRQNEADLSRTLIHEYAHARPHFDIDAPEERAKREIEAEAVAYVVGRYFGLDTSNSAFYLVTWRDEEADVIQERLSRISTVSDDLIEVIENQSNHAENGINQYSIGTQDL